MRTANIFFFFFCLVATTFCFVSHNSINPSSLTFLPARRRLRESRISLSKQQHRTFKVGVKLKRAKNAESGSMAMEYSSSNENLNENAVEETVYHIDYHGVTTHPIPTPKHPLEISIKLSETIALT